MFSTTLATRTTVQTTPDFRRGCANSAQMQSDVQRRTFLVLLMQNIRNGGVISLWAGFSSMLARDVPYTMLK